MIAELLIEPAQFLVDALNEKSAKQLIELIYQSVGCERVSSIAIHVTAIDTLMRKYPSDYEHFSNPNRYEDECTEGVTFF